MIALAPAPLPPPACRAAHTYASAAQAKAHNAFCARHPPPPVVVLRPAFTPAPARPA